jgi:hypothetical protein
MNELTQRGITALKSGDRVTARKLLAGAIQQDANDIVAWLWLTATVDNDEDRIACLEQVLKIDPNNQVAERGLAQIQARRGHVEAPPESSPVVSQPEDGPQPIQEPSQPSAPVIQADAPVIQAEAPQMVSEPAPEPANAAQAASLFAEPLDEDLPKEVAAASAIAAEPPAEVSTAVLPALSSSASAPAVPSDNATATDAPPSRTIFRVRPSQVPALLFFWVFLFGALLVGKLLGSIPQLAFPLTGGLWFLLELVVLYVIIRNLTVRYELTNQALNMRFLGKRAHIRTADIFDAQMSQSFLQQIIGIGHIDLHVTINGELAHVRLRDIPQCRTRLDQILAMLRDQQNA